MGITVNFFVFFVLLFIYFLSIFYWLCYYSFPNFSPFIPPPPHTPQPSSIPPLSSCPWVVHISSLNSLFPTPFLTSPCLFYAYQLALAWWLGWSIVLHTKRSRVHFRSGHIPRLRFDSRLGHIREVTDRCFSVSFSPFLSLKSENISSDSILKLNFYIQWH